MAGTGWLPGHLPNRVVAMIADAANNRAMRKAIGVAILVALAVLVVGFAFVSQEFGYYGAAVYSLILVPPLVVAIRLYRKWPSASVRELVFLAVTFFFAIGGAAFILNAWYADGLDRDHAEDVKWDQFEKRVRKDPRFQNVQIHKSERKNVYWVTGTVESQADLERLRSLAAECEIDRQRLDGPYVHSISLTVGNGGNEVKDSVNTPK